MMRMSLWEYANPVRFMQASGRLLPPVAIAAGFACVIGLVWGFAFTPPEARQGASARIMFLHVPAAMMAINAWAMMLVASLIWLIRRHHVSALAARAAAPVGAVFCAVALVTGALWGQVAWGTWWEWDPKLTSFLVLMLFYIGHVALWNVVDEPDVAADLTAMMVIVGSVFAALSRYALLFWTQGIHQNASLSVASGTRMAWEYKAPLYLCMAGFVLLFVALVLLRTRTEIRRRRLSAIHARQTARETMQEALP